MGTDKSEPKGRMPASRRSLMADKTERSAPEVASAKLAGRLAIKQPAVKRVA